MKVKTISVGYRRKFNLGDFNSVDLEAWASADLEDSENEQQALQELSQVVTENVKNRATPWIREKAVTMNIKEMFAGLPVELQEVVKQTIQSKN